MTRRRSPFFFVATAATFAVASACSPTSTPPSSASLDAATSSGVAIAASTPIAPRPIRGEAPGGSPRRASAKWQAALGGDPLDVLALAQFEGATGLLEGVEDGGDLLRVACEALPLAEDSDLALGRLGELARGSDASISDIAVVTLRRIAFEPPSRGESLDPDGVASAAAALLSLAKQNDLPRERRAAAISAARAFAERGALDPDTIPTELDPALTEAAP